MEDAEVGVRYGNSKFHRRNEPSHFACFFSIYIEYARTTLNIVFSVI